MPPPSPTRTAAQFVPETTLLVADHVLLDLPAVWRGDVAYKFDPSIHSRERTAEGAVWTDRLRNVSGGPLRPVEVFLGKLQAVATREIVVHFGNVGEEGARIVAQGEVLLRRGEEERRGASAQIDWERCTVLASTP